jgi:hypothetical protein
LDATLQSEVRILTSVLPDFVDVIRTT